LAAEVVCRARECSHQAFGQQVWRVPIRRELTHCEMPLGELLLP
jgi:hypothetical protein